MHCKRAVLAAGGRFLTRGIPEKAYEHGVKERTVVVEFESLAQAIACTRESRVPSGARRSGEWGRARLADRRRHRRVSESKCRRLSGHRALITSNPS